MTSVAVRPAGGRALSLGTTGAARGVLCVFPPAFAVSSVRRLGAGRLPFLGNGSGCSRERNEDLSIGDICATVGERPRLSPSASRDALGRFSVWVFSVGTTLNSVDTSFVSPGVECPDCNRRNECTTLFDCLLIGETIPDFDSELDSTKIAFGRRMWSFDDEECTNSDGDAPLVLIWTFTLVVVHLLSCPSQSLS